MIPSFRVARFVARRLVVRCESTLPSQDHAGIQEGIIRVEQNMDSDRVDPREGTSMESREESRIKEYDPEEEKERKIFDALRETYFDDDLDRPLPNREFGGAFRRIVYNEGELDKTDFNKPPSKRNPYPVDTSMFPPSHSRSLAPYVNYSPLLQKLVHLGVDLFEIEMRHPQLPRHVMRLTYAEVRDKMRWLVSLGVEPSILGDYLTRNPFFLIQNLDDMKARVNFLKVEKYSNNDIVKIITEFRYWLNIDVKTTSSRMDWLREKFHLKKSELRRVIAMEPRIVMFGLGPISRLYDLLHKEYGFTDAEMKTFLLADPRLFIMDERVVAANYAYCTRVMGLPHGVLLKNPLILRVALSSLKCRHEFLRRLGRARYKGAHEAQNKKRAANERSEKNAENQREKDELVDGLISLDDFLSPSDREFAENTARVSAASYDLFLRSH